LIECKLFGGASGIRAYMIAVKRSVIRIAPLRRGEQMLRGESVFDHGDLVSMSERRFGNKMGGKSYVFNYR